MRIADGYQLPRNYKKIEYIENTNTCWIDTGVVALNKLFVMDVQFTSTATRQLMGIGPYSSEYFGVGNNGAWERVGNSEQVPVLSRCNIYYDVGNITAKKTNTWINNSTVKQEGSTPNWDTEVASTLKLFRLGTTTYWCMTKLFGLKVYNGSNQITNNFIPCVRKSDDKAGLYDVINNTFVVRQAATSGHTFSRGSSIQKAFKSATANIVLNPAFQQIEYIQANGAQKIQLNITPTSKYKIEEEFAITDKTITSCLWCARGATTSSSTVTAFNIANSQLRCDYGVTGSMTNAGNLVANQKYKLTMNAEKWYLDDVLKVTNTAATFTAGGPLTLFYSYYNGVNNNLANYAKIKLYSFKVWNDTGVMIANLIPCYRKSNGDIGLYNIMDDTFYTNIGTGTFSKGNDCSNSACKPILPLYQQLEYIQSNSAYSHYVDINYIAKANNIIIDLDMMWTGNTVSAFETFIGFMYSPSTVTPRIGLHKWSSSLMFGANATTNSGITPPQNIRFSYKGDFTSGAQKLYKNNGSPIASNTTKYDFTNNPCPMYLFARYCPGSENYANMRMYSCKIYEGANLVKDLIPCKRLVDNVLGVYDKVSKQFYITHGSGEFTAGNPIVGNLIYI